MGLRQVSFLDWKTLFVSIAEVKSVEDRVLMMPCRIAVPRFLLPTLACMLSAFLLSFIHWYIFNPMADAASAMQTFHALARDSLYGWNSLENVGVFGVHFWPLGLLALPFFRLCPSYLTLVAFQAVFVGMSVPAVGRMVQGMGADSRSQSAWMCFWGLHPLLLGAHCGWGEGWQPLILSITPLTWAIAFALEDRWIAFGSAMTLAILARQDVAFMGLGMGLWLYFGCRRKGPALAVALFSLVWLVFTMGWLLPKLSGGNWSVVEKAMPSLDGTASSIMRTLLHRPWLLLQNWFRWHSFLWLAFLWLAWGGGFRWFRANALLAILPWGAILLSLEPWNTRLPFIHYGAPMLPFLLLAALQTHGSAFPGRALRSGYILCFCAFLCWQGRLISNGLSGLNRAAYLALEHSLPHERSLTIFSPRGAARFSWGQNLHWYNGDSLYLKDALVLVDLGRKRPPTFSRAELEAAEHQLPGHGFTLVFRQGDLRLWSKDASLQIASP